uniref:Activin_recp domain-containing protein n=1 Tax=Parastrongyloides trichosuri TaxID=131310 RepID=A0A0N5A0G9_PARTI
MKKLFYSLILFNFFFKVIDAKKVICESCFASCKLFRNGTFDIKSCDCSNKEVCHSEACFAKIETFAEEKIAIVQKGCITEVPGGLDGCYHNGQTESIHCYCTSDRCNTASKLNNFKANNLPIVECCDCSESSGGQCNELKCQKTCKGNYCVADLEGNDQGCGYGLPRLAMFLRMPDYIKWQGSTICSRYQAGSTVINGCTCTSPTGNCNEMTKTKEYQNKNVILRNLDNQNYCYSLHQKSAKPFKPNIFKKSETCEGQYCFFSITTSELTIESEEYHDALTSTTNFIGTTRPYYEILAGCLKVDNDEKLSLGCTKEFNNEFNNSTLSKQCICDTHLCNYEFFIEEYPNATIPNKLNIIGKNNEKFKLKHRLDKHHHASNESSNLNSSKDEIITSTSSSIYHINCAANIMLIYFIIMCTVQL